MIDAVLGGARTGEWSPDEAAAWAARTPLDPGVLSPVGVIDARALSHGGALDLLTALERIRSWVDGQQQRVLARLADDDAALPGLEGATLAKGYAREEVAAVLRIAPATAEARIGVACILSSSFPAVLDAVEAGTLTLQHARVLVDEAMGCLSNLRDPERSVRARRIERQALALAPGSSVGAFRRCVARIVAGLDSRGVAERHREAVAERRVCLTAEPDGMAWLSAYLPAPDATTVMTALNATATHRAGGSDTRTADQRRADAFVQFAVDALKPGAAHATAAGAPGTNAFANPALPAWQGRRPAVNVTVALSTLAGIDEQPAELDGYGAIPAELARRIAADPSGTWERLITDPVGRVLDYRHTRYRPPADLREHLIARDRTCRFPGCARAARRCEQDHLCPRTDGGHTSAANMHCLCPRHHHLRHDTDWTPSRDPGTGVTTWTAPNGRRYREPPDTVPIDRTRPTRE